MKPPSQPKQEVPLAGPVEARDVHNDETGLCVSATRHVHRELVLSSACRRSLRGEWITASLRVGSTCATHCQQFQKRIFLKTSAPTVARNGYREIPPGFGLIRGSAPFTRQNLGAPSVNSIRRIEARSRATCGEVHWHRRIRAGPQTPPATKIIFAKLWSSGTYRVGTRDSADFFKPTAQRRAGRSRTLASGSGESRG